MAVQFKGTPTGDRASKMMESIRANARKDPWALPDLAVDEAAGQAGERSQPHPGPVVSAGERPVEVGSPTPAAVDTPDDGDHRILPAAVVAGGLVIVGAGVAWIRRRKRLA